MKLKTHMLIARNIHDYMNLNYSNNISRKHFVFGNIKPDLMRKFRRLKHSIHDSFDYVVDEVNRLDSEIHTVKNPSVLLGEINHYLSDFFCSKHYYKEKKTHLIKHIKYEGNVQKAIFDMNISEDFDFPYAYIAKKAVSFSDMLRELEAEYRKQPPSIENDIIFALCAPLVACSFIFRERAIKPEALEQAA